MEQRNQNDCTKNGDIFQCISIKVNGERGKTMSKRTFNNPQGSEEKVLNKCPLCGAELEYNQLIQFSDVFKVLKNGTLAKNRKYRREEGSMDCGFLSCTKCDFYTDCDLNCEDNKEIHIWQDGSAFMYTQDEDE